MRKQTLKAIGIVFIGLLIWNIMIYISLSFIKSETNPFDWSQDLRTSMIFISSIYLCFCPLFVNELKDWL